MKRQLRFLLLLIVIAALPLFLLSCKSAESSQTIYYLSLVDSPREVEAVKKQNYLALSGDGTYEFSVALPQTVSLQSHTGTYVKTEKAFIFSDIGECAFDGKQIALLLDVESEPSTFYYEESNKLNAVIALIIAVAGALLLISGIFAFFIIKSKKERLKNEEAVNKTPPPKI